MDAADLQELFGPKARAEVAIAGRITLANGLQHDVTGQVDRIAETETDVIIADYKTGAVPEAGAIPEAYLTQMALYQATLAPLWPAKKLRMLLIFTAGPKVMELEDAMLAMALAALDV